MSDIRSELSKLKNVNSTVINSAIRLSLEDKYLSDLINDCLQENNEHNKNEMAQEIVNYTEEVLRKSKLNK